MSAEVVTRQASGWWPSLVHAVCERCGWVGPVRNLYTPTGGALVRLDQVSHECGEVTR